MRDVIIFVAGVCVGFFIIGDCSAQTTTTYVNQYGQPVATAQQVGNTVYYSNQFGQFMGTAQTVQQPVQPAPLPQSSQVPPVLPIIPILGAPR